MGLPSDGGCDARSQSLIVQPKIVDGSRIGTHLINVERAGHLINVESAEGFFF